MKKCKQITELISLSQEQTLALKAKCEVKFHLFFCPYCRAFKQNAQKMRELMMMFRDKH